MRTQSTPEHARHQEMLRLHRMQKLARRERGQKGQHKLYKQDSEMLGFKPICLPRNDGGLLMFSRKKVK